jgi:hypothetical protein
VRPHDDRRATVGAGDEATTDRSIDWNGSTTDRVDATPDGDACG